jgi:ubiquinol-cytochrome c reductase cytochrome c1 subunit
MNKMLKKILLAMALCASLVSAANAATGGIAWDKAPSRTNDMAALQRGAQLFANYCLNCHSAAYMRYNRMQDIGLSDKQIKENLNFISDKSGDLMKATINPLEAKAWFGAAPPDLSVIARSRAGANGSGADYIYTFLRGYYRDGTTLTGWNNAAFPAVAMPNPLWQLQGQQEMLTKEVEAHGHTTHVFNGFKQVSAGTMSEAQFDSAVGDLVAYLQWMGEPAQNTRVRIGVWVLLFLSIFTLVAWRLNAAFWKDIK